MRIEQRGVGDVFAAVTRRVGIKPCRGCLKRKAAFNRLSIPVPVRNKAARAKEEAPAQEGHTMTEAQYRALAQAQRVRQQAPSQPSPLTVAARNMRQAGITDPAAVRAAMAELSRS